MNIPHRPNFDLRTNFGEPSHFLTTRFEEPHFHGENVLRYICVLYERKGELIKIRVHYRFTKCPHREESTHFRNQFVYTIVSGLYDKNNCANSASSLL